MKVQLRLRLWFHKTRYRKGGSLTVALVREAAKSAAILTKAHGKPIGAPGGVCHPQGRSKAEDGEAVDRSREAWPTPSVRCRPRPCNSSDANDTAANQVSSLGLCGFPLQIDERLASEPCRRD